MAFLQFRPGCIFDHNLALEINFTLTKGSRDLQGNNTALKVQQVHTNETIIEKSYKIALRMDSGKEKSFRGKILDENGKEFASLDRQGIHVSVSYPSFRACSTKSISLDSSSIFNFMMPLMNESLPYIMEVSLFKQGEVPLIIDSFVGGTQQEGQDVVELGQYQFLKQENQSINILGRLFDAFTNKTLTTDYSLTVFEGFGG